MKYIISTRPDLIDIGYITDGEKAKLINEGTEYISYRIDDDTDLQNLDEILIWQ